MVNNILTDIQIPPTPATMVANITSFPTAVRRRLANGPLYYGWFVVGVCFLCVLITWGTVWSFGVFFGYIVSDFGLSHGNTSIIFSIQSIVTYGGAAVLGLVIDRFGVRRLLFIATGLIAGGLVGVSLLPKFSGVVFAYSIVAATGFSIVHVIGFTTPSRWFDRRRGLATGLAVAGASTGTLLIPFVSEILISRLGWRGAYGGLTISFLIILVVTLLIIADQPTTLGIDTSTESPSGELTKPPMKPDLMSQVRDVLTVAGSPAFLVLFLAFLSFAIPTGMVMVHIVEFTTVEGFGRSLGVAAISIIGLMGIISRSLGGALSDHVGRARTIAAGGLLLGVGIGILLGGNTARTIVVAVVLFGIGWGFWISPLAAYLADLFGILSINALFGVTMIAFAIAGSGAPYVAGIAFDMMGTYDPPFLVGGVLGILGSALVFAVDRLHNPDI